MLVPRWSRPEQRATARWPGRVRRWIGPVVLALFLLRALAVDVAGIVTNDSLGYLVRADDPFGSGFVVQGYRQAAFPVWVHLVSGTDVLLGIDTVFAVAMAQRFLLLLGIALLWGALRWWVAPLLVVLTSATFVIHTDYLLPEGFLVPCCVLAGGLAASVVTQNGFGGRHPQAALLLVTALAVAMGAMKLQYAALLLLSASLAWLVVRDKTVSLKLAVTTVVTGGALLSGLALAQAAENHRELGAWEPVGERGRAEWYGAWQSVFKVTPENRRKPELAEYFDQGNLYTFLHGIEQSEPDYATRTALIHERVTAMFEAAGTSARREQLAAFLGGIKGGRTDDVAGISDAAVRDRQDTRTVRLSFNSTGRQGTQAVLDQVNHGRATEVLSIEAVTGRLQSVVQDYRPARPWLGIGAVVLALLSCGVRGRHRPIAVGATLFVLAESAGLATGYIDNARYLAGPMALSLVAATLGARALLQAASVRLRTAQPDTDETPRA